MDLCVGRKILILFPNLLAVRIKEEPENNTIILVKDLSKIVKYFHI